MKKGSKNQLLLLEDVTNLGRKGDLVYAKSGFVRNFLLPQKRAVLADKRTVRMQQRLQEERAKQAALDKKDAQIIAEKLRGCTLAMKVRTDTQGHLYGSVSAQNIVERLAKEGVTIEKKNIVLPKPIKLVGVFTIALHLKENVSSSFTLKVEGDNVVAGNKIPTKEDEKSSDSAVEEGKPSSSVKGQLDDEMQSSK